MRFPEVLFRATVLVVLAFLALALLGPRPAGLPEVRLNRLVRVEGERPGTQGEKYAEELSRTASVAAGTWRAEFEIHVPSGSTIWLAGGDIGVAVLAARGDWTRMGSDEESPALPGSGLSGGRTISRTIWRVLPAGAKRCRLTIGFRHLTLQERGTRVLDKSGVSRRLPAISGWITKHLPATELWLACRREVPVTVPWKELETPNWVQATLANAIGASWSQGSGAPGPVR
jgi:hypothetical protein